MAEFAIVHSVGWPDCERRAEVRILTERRYGFTALPPDVWSALAEVDRYDSWWPWLRRFDAQALASGVSWHFTIRPPLPYAVRCRVDLVTVEAPRLVSARVYGDLLGRATVALHPLPDGPGTELRITSALEAHSLAARLGSAVFPRLARRGHDWVFDTGAQQFARAHGWGIRALDR
jgi:uncharacterized protein YndB with AHSA1/START domain